MKNPLPDDEAAREQEAREQELTRVEIRRRASAGLFVVASWGLANLLTAFFGNLVLARLLDPRAFGVVAVGSTVMIISAAVAEGGLGNAFVRRPEPPTAADLRTLTGVQLSFSMIVVVVVVAVGLSLGEVGQVTALMVLGLPLASAQSAGRVRLARDLHFRQITLIDAMSVLTYYAWSIAAVLLGAGVWGLASGTVARAAAGMVVVALIPSARLHRPSLSSPGGSVRCSASAFASRRTG